MMERAMNEGYLLVVEDEKVQRETLTGFLVKRGFKVESAESGEQALEKITDKSFDLVLTDQRMSGIDGLELLERVKSRNPETEVIVLTAHGEVQSAVAATKQGAYDYLLKPIDLEQLELAIRRALERRQLVLENRQLRETLGERHSFGNIISVSGAMESVLNMAARVAKVDSPVLITGESGTGKEMIARAIHQASERADKPFIAVNLAALNENLIESELFGHEKGSFTGAVKQRAGKLEAADGGTLFLDELGEISQEIQVKLLRFLQEKTFERVGGDTPLSSDVRLLTATNRDLEKAIAENRFREDFYYRVNVVNIHIPPLRSRKEDICPLLDYFVERNAERLGAKKFSREALDALMRYDFPGNIRELQNIVERSMVMARGSVIDAADLPPNVRGVQAAQPATPDADDLTGALEALERSMIAAALRECDGVQTRAAEKLGISERTLRYKMKNLGL